MIPGESTEYSVIIGALLGARASQTDNTWPPTAAELFAFLSFQIVIGDMNCESNVEGKEDSHVSQFRLINGAASTGSSSSALIM